MTDLTPLGAPPTVAFEDFALALGNLTDLADPLQIDFPNFTPPFELNPNMDVGGFLLSSERSIDASGTGIQPAYAVSVNVDGGTEHSELERMFGGVGVYAQSRLDGVATDGTANTFISAIAGYSVQNLQGDGDAIGVHGRARKTDIAGNVGDAAGTLGDAFQFSTLLGGVIGLEGRIYNNAEGRGPSDNYNGGAWETALNLISDSTGSPALAAIMMTSEGPTSGKFGFWNGITMSRQTFAHNGEGGGIAGTVGINMADWTISRHAQYAIKVGYADGDNSYHLYRGDNAIHFAGNLLQVKNPSTGPSGLRVVGGGNGNAYVDFVDGNTLKGYVFWNELTNKFTLGSPQDIDVVLRQDGEDRITLTAFGATVMGRDDAPAGLVINSDNNANTFLDFNEGGANKLKLNWDTALDVGILGTVGANALFLRTNSVPALRINADQTMDTFEDLFVDGALRVSPGNSVALSQNGQIALQATSDTTLTIKHRGTDGTTRSVDLTLA